MENVSPLAMNNDKLPTLDDLLRPKRNVKASRQKRSPALNTRTNGDHENEDSGLLTPPSSQTQEGDDASKMLFSPPPEEELRSSSRNPVVCARSLPVEQPSFTPCLLAGSPPFAATSSSSKRKRHAHNRSSPHIPLDLLTNASNVVITEATPNPKPRKQYKHGSPSFHMTELVDEPTTPTRVSARRSESPTKRSLLSPHHSNPNADYLPPLPIISRQALLTRRRSATPIPPYEPPKERFTPPREIIHTPPPRATQSPERMSKSSTRKSVAPKNAKKLALTIKKEPPKIDLSLPPPPPSPTDDPLLLKGGQRRRHAPRISVASSTHSRETPSVASSSPVSPPNVRLPDLSSSIDTSMQDDGVDDSFAGVPSIFDFTGAEEDPAVWDDVDSDSEPDEFDQSGEYTGHFKMLVVPTKADPPSSCTRTRQDAWGCPISPYPGSGARRRSLPSSSSPPLKAGLDGLDGTDSGENLDEEDVFFLDAPGAGCENDIPDFIEGSSCHLQDHPNDRMEVHGTLKSRTPEPLFSPLPIVDAPELDLVNEQYVRFAVPRLSSGDVSMAFEAESCEDLEPQEDPVMPVGAETRGPPEPDYDSDSGDEQTVDRELSREPEPYSDIEDDEDGSHPAPPVATPPRAITPARSVSPQTGQPVRPRGFLSITSPLRRQKSPQAQIIQRHGEDMPSIQTVFAALAPAQTDITITEAFPKVIELEIQTSTESPAIEQVVENGDEAEYVATDVESSDDESDDLDNAVVKITSGDPRVAARAAAILKMHKYDFIIRDQLRAHRYSSVDSAMRRTRRRSVIEGGVTKRGTPIRRRRTLGGVIGDQVFIPGSPIITVPQLLQEAELTIEQRERQLHTPTRGPSVSDNRSFKVPLSMNTPMLETRRKVYARPIFNACGPRAWEKDDWKLLDACFTDERLALGSHKRLGEAILAPVDDIVPENVLKRFTEHTGGVPIEECWPGWTEGALLRRVHALQRRQRAGKGAPPTPSRLSSVALSEVPDFTPLPSRQSSMQPGLDRQGPFQSNSNRPAVPASLLAPRYSHLLDEAIAISRSETGTQSNVPPNEYRSASVPILDERAMSLLPQSPTSVPRSESEAPVAPAEEIPTSRSIASRMKGFLFSYLPRASKSVPVKRPPLPAHPGLPIPPPEVFQKPRGPIATPVSKPSSKPVHPRDLVHLNHAPPPKPSMIPRPAQKKPHRLVELHPVPPLDPRPRSSTGITSLGDRRSSSGSVKDLVRGFEDMERRQERERLEEVSRLRRVKSVGEWAASLTRGSQQDQKPTWKP